MMLSRLFVSVTHMLCCGCYDVFVVVCMSYCSLHRLKTTVACVDMHMLSQCGFVFVCDGELIFSLLKLNVFCLSQNEGFGS